MRAWWFWPKRLQNSPRHAGKASSTGSQAKRTKCDMQSAVLRAMQKAQFVAWSGLEAALRKLGSFGAMRGRGADGYGLDHSAEFLRAITVQGGRAGLSHPPARAIHIRVQE